MLSFIIEGPKTVPFVAFDEGEMYVCEMVQCSPIEVYKDLVGGICSYMAKQRTCLKTSF